MHLATRSLQIFLETGGPNTLALLIQERECERLQSKPATSFGLVSVQAVPVDAVLSEFVTVVVPGS